jgi:hypothetical protein
VFDDATLATREKGRQLVEALVERMLSEIEDLRHARLPQPGARQSLARRVHARSG